MINVWDYQDVEEVVKITDVNGQVYIGTISEIVDAEEESTDYGFGEDSIGIECRLGYLGLPQSAIKSIEIIK